MNSFHEYFVLILRRWEIVFWTSGLCLGIACIMAFGPEPVYRSSGTILAERPDISSDLVKSTVDGLYEQRLQIVRRRVVTGQNLRPIIEKYDLYPNLPEDDRSSHMKDGFSMEQVDAITGEPSEGSDAFSLHFVYGDPELAQTVASEIIDLFLQDNRRQRTETAKGTEEFFANETRRLSTEVVAAEERLAEFKTSNQGLLPADIDRNQQVLERLNRELPEIQTDIRLAQERKNLLAVQRDELSGDTELALLKTELSIAQQKYSDDHPDVRRLKRTISVLEDAERSGDIDPELLRVQEQMRAVDAEISAFKQRESQLKRRVADLEGQQVMAPEIEKQLQVLNREYDLAVSEYEDMRQKRSAAEISSNLEVEDKGERYSVIREPGVPRSPFKPNRLGIMLIGFLFAFGGSAGIVAFRENMDATVRGTHDILAALNGPPIASIPRIMNVSDAYARFWRFARHTTAFLVFVVGVYIVITFDLLRDVVY